MNSLLVRNALLNGQLTSIYCEDGIIQSLGEEPDAERVLDAKGMTVHPPFVNSHTHAAMTLFRGNGDDLPLMEWLQTRIWPYEKNIRSEEVYWGTKLALVEMIHSGITYFADMYWDLPAVVRAVDDMGIRACLSAVFIDFNDPGIALEQQKNNERLYDRYKDYSRRIELAIGPHAIYTVSESSLRWAREFTDEHEMKLHIHLSETIQEVEECKAKHGKTPVQYLDSLGLINERLIAAHTVVLDETDIRLLGNHHALCVHNPVSNMKLAVGGVYPYYSLKKAGAVTAIATDGAGSNNNLDLLEDMKIASLLQKHHLKDPTALSASEVVEMVTVNPASFFHYPSEKIAVGGMADFILLDLNQPELKPIFDLNSHLVYAANHSIVDSLICDGAILMEHHYIPGEEEILENAILASRSMMERVDANE